MAFAFGADSKLVMAMANRQQATSTILDEALPHVQLKPSKVILVPIRPNPTKATYRHLSACPDNLCFLQTVHWKYCGNEIDHLKTHPNQNMDHQ